MKSKLVTQTYGIRKIGLALALGFAMTAAAGIEVNAATVVTLQNPTSAGSHSIWANSWNPAHALSDTFLYDPNFDYYSITPSQSQNSTVPITQGNPTQYYDEHFLSHQTNGSNWWGVDVALASGQSLDFLDIWGRTDDLGGYDRAQGLTITFFSGTGQSGSVLGSFVGFDVVPMSSTGAHGEFYSRFNVSSAVFSEASRAQIQSLRIEKTNNNYLLLSEVRAGGNAIPEPSSMLLAACCGLGLAGLRRRNSLRNERG